ncbi:MAG: cytochrome b/b6 domain-containing protein [Pyrinomonadaceae bacterium]
MKKIVEKHPLAIRWFHWINFPLLFLMIWSGLLIYWSNSVYDVRIGSWTLFHFFPAWFYDKLGIPFRLAEGMALHFFFMWFFAVNGLLYVLYTIFSGEWRLLVPDRHSFREAILVTLHDLHLRSYAPPQLKYNGAQKIAYTAVVVMGAGSLLTGLAIYKPVQFAWLTKLLLGYEWARWEHFWLTVGYVLFFIVHVAQVVKAGWSNFRSMIAGFDVLRTDDATTQAVSTPDALAVEEATR